MNDSTIQKESFDCVSLTSKIATFYEIPPPNVLRDILESIAADPVLRAAKLRFEMMGSPILNYRPACNVFVLHRALGTRGYVTAVKASAVLVISPWCLL